MSRTHHALFDFHQRHVRVPERELARLRRLRNLNVERLETALADLGGPELRFKRGQGGYAMHTLTQRDDGEQDIDVALGFGARDLPDQPAAARSLVWEAVLAAAPDTFHRLPERRTNAVTVWYAGGYHIDFAIYRTDGRITEHAGASWRTADPVAAATWLSAEAQARSPHWYPGALLQDRQLLRVVRILKYLRHGDDEDYPGGYILTALACHCYEPRPDGDDLALLLTMRNAERWIRERRDLVDPPYPSRSLLERRRDVARLTRFGELLAEVLEPLRPYLRRETLPPVEAWERALNVELHAGPWRA